MGAFPEGDVSSRSVSFWKTFSRRMQNPHGRAGTFETSGIFFFLVHIEICVETSEMRNKVQQRVAVFNVCAEQSCDAIRQL
jgi:hypothetical protein